MDINKPNYPTDLTDCEWRHIHPCIPDSRPIGIDRATSMRSVVNAIIYRSRTGCPWRMLPRDFPHWRTVYGYFHQWQFDGTWEKIQGSLKTVPCRVRRGQPSLGLPHKPARVRSEGPFGAVSSKRLESQGNSAATE